MVKTVCRKVRIRRAAAGNQRPRVFEINENCSISWPTASTIFLHFRNKIEIVKFFDESVIVKLIEEFRSIINIQPVVNDPTFAKYFHVSGSVNEVI